MNIRVSEHYGNWNISAEGVLSPQSFKCTLHDMSEDFKDHPSLTTS